MKKLLLTSMLVSVCVACSNEPPTDPAAKTDIILALPTQNAGIPDGIIMAASSAFNQTGAGESLRVLLLDNGSSALSMSVEDRKRFQSETFRAEGYADELATLQGMVREINSLPEISYSELKSDIPSVLSAAGAMRGPNSRPAKMLIVGGGLQMTPDNPTTSMYVNGRSLVASDTLLTDTLLTSPYGLGYDRDYLSGVDVYFCAVLPDGLTPFEMQEVGRMWGHYVALRNGRLMTFTPDVDLCVEQFSKGNGEPLALRPLDTEIEPAMIAADKSGLVKRITATEAEKHRAEVAAIAAERDAERQARKIAEKEAEIERNKPPKIVTKTVTKTVYDDGARFEHNPHPTRSHLSVSTGVEYAKDKKHGYINAWCYMHVRSKRGVQLSIDIGKQNAGHKPRYSRPDKTTLREAGLSQHDFKVARQACRFPK